MKIKTVGNGLDRSVKKILSLILSLAMLCTIMTAFGITASAEGAIEISDFATLKSTIGNAKKPIVIDITADITDGTSIINIVNGKDITINLNGHTIIAGFIDSVGRPSTLTINGRGILKGYASGAYGRECVNFYGGSTLNADNVKFIGGKSDQENGMGAAALRISNSTVKLDNCYVSGGDSSSTKANRPAVDSTSGKIYAKNCTFVRGTGGDTTNSKTIKEDLYNLETGEQIGIVDFYQNPIVVGNGYSETKLSGTISDAEGTPASDNSLVLANTNIPAPTYTVTIPSTVNFGDQKQALEKYRSEDSDQFGKAVVVSKPFTVSATGVANLFNDLDDNKDDYINVTAEFDGTLKGTTNTENTVPYTIKQGENTLTTNDIIATFYNDVDLASKNATNSVAATIYMNRADIKNVDSYIGTMTFNIARAVKANG